MTILFVILIVITCAALAFFVLIQNPKGGGLSGSFGGFGNQMMGAKQSTDVVEKGTWVAASALLLLTLVSFVLAPDASNASLDQKTRAEQINKGVQAPTMPQAPQTAPAPASAPAPAPAGQAAPAPAPADAAPATK